jgi:dCMP deaminase
VLVSDQRIIATSHNGTPTEFPNFTTRRLPRVRQPVGLPARRGCDVCICVHAEPERDPQAAKLSFSVHGAHCARRCAVLRLPQGYQAGVSHVRA